MPNQAVQERCEGIAATDDRMQIHRLPLTTKFENEQQKTQWCYTERKWLSIIIRSVMQ